MQKKITLSVRELVEFLMLSGSLDSRLGSADRAAEGARIHRLVQKSADSNYTAEVSFSETTEMEDFTFFIRGRADGVITEADGIVIDEIKSTTRELSDFDDGPTPVHLAQAKCYGYIYAKQQLCETIDIQMTYYQVDSKEILRIRESYSFTELESFYFDLLIRYLSFARLQDHWLQKRNESIAQLHFPYPTYRSGQRELAVVVYNGIRAEKNLFCQAPTGIGKTLSVIFPALKTMGEGYIGKIFYLTAKTITRMAAADGIRLLEDEGLRAKVVMLTAKEKICFLEKPSCNPEDCPYAVEYFQKVREGLGDILSQYDTFSRETIVQIAREHEICPFEFSLELVKWCDIVIADYNYLFDPKVGLSGVFENDTKDFVYLVDEAHNLVDRGRSMYSATLAKSQVLKVKRILDKGDKVIKKPLSKINTYLLELRKQREDAAFSAQAAPLIELKELISYFCFAWEGWIKKHPDHPDLELLLDLYFSFRDYLRIAELYDTERFMTTIAVKGSEVSVKLFCLDPSSFIAEKAATGRSMICFSATLLPMPYFKRLLLGDIDTPDYRLPSPFDPGRLGILLADGVSTKYSDRESSYRIIAEMIGAFTESRRGNYIVYFPSYAYMEAVHEIFQTLYPEIKTLVQERTMNEVDREAFLAAFERNDQTRVGFCVMGGIYAEGIDLKGDRLIGTVIVGVGLPKINPEGDLIRDHFDALADSENDSGEIQGFAYAYQYPGMNKVLQAMGRVIRDEQDRGMALLIDSRFTRQDYRQLFPEYLSHYVIVRSTAEIRSECDQFWQKNK